MATASPRPAPTTRRATATQWLPHRLRVRCVTLGHEKANLSEHMELLEEHLERLKADLDHKHAEVNEVEHQWSQTKAKLPG